MSIFDMLIDLVEYTIARLVFPLLSFRRVYVQRLSAPREGFNALGWRDDGNGRIEVEATIAGFIGFILGLLVLFTLGLLIHAAV